MKRRRKQSAFLSRQPKLAIYTHTEACDGISSKTVESKEIATAVSNEWWERFCQRHPKLILKTAVPLSYLRAVATDPICNRSMFLICWRKLIRAMAFLTDLSIYLTAMRLGFHLILRYIYLFSFRTFNSYKN